MQCSRHCSGRLLQGLWPSPSTHTQELPHTGSCLWIENQDGYLDTDELRLRPAWAQALAAADQDRDGRIGHSEFLSLLDRMHARR
jgi:hypothetical protein